MRIRQRVVSIAIPILALSALALMLGAVPAQAASLAFVQSSSADPQTSPTSLTVTYAAAQTAGNLNVVIVGWNNATALISSVTDSKGNAYVLAVGPTVQAGVATQAIYYAKNIASAAAGTNIVTVTFNAAASFPDIRIAEYSGVDTVNPVDVVAANQGSTSSSSSGAVTTTNANDLLVAGNVIQTLTTGAGTSFTKRVITSPDGDILEDRIVTATGSYTGTAPVSPAGQWIMQMVAFRAAGGGSGPGITTLNPTSGTIGVSVTITGTNLGSSQGGSTVTFNGTTATPTSWNATTIVVPVPTGATTGNVVVTVNSVASNGVNFTVTPPPGITTLNPTFGPVATSVTITGTNFGASQGSSTVTFNGTTATPTSWNATTIVVPVPTGATTGNVVVTVGGVASNGVSFTVTPGITSLNPTSGTIGASVTITGTNLGSSQGGSTVTFNGTTATPTSWNATTIVVPVPTGATTGNVVVTVNSVASNGVNFTVTPPPGITTLNPTFGPVATSVTITGTNFGASQGSSTVTFNGTTATPTSWNATTIVVPVPAAATTGNVVVTVGGVASNGVSFTVTPGITSLNPTSGPVTTPVTITGTNLGSSQGGSTVTFNGTTATPTSWNATTIVVPVPTGATTGNVVVTVNSVASNGVNFTVTPPPGITTLNPTSGPVATSVTITGANFGASQGSSTVTFNGTAATPSSWNATTIVVPVPAAATTGNVVVTVGGVASNGVSFTVTPGITSLNPTSGTIGASVTITGTNFGASQGGSTVTFNGTTATPTSWNATTIVVPVPTGATTGNVVVTVNSVASNGVSFTVTTGIANISLVQHTSKDAGTTTSSTLAFASNNTAGNWIAVLIRAGHTGQVFTVTDSRGNTYKSAVQYNMSLDAESLAIFYAESIAGGANTVTVSDTTSGTLRFAILEYTGVASSSSIDVTQVAQGTSTAPNSGSATTTSAGDLVLGEITTGNGATYTAGSGFTIEERVPAAPNTKLIAEDAVQPTVATVAASASLPASDNWGAVLATFKPGNGTGGTGPSITSLNPTSGAVGTPVTITGTNFGASQGSSAVTFNGVAATPTSWSGTSIVAPVPTGATTGSVVVTVGGVSSNGVNFAVTSSTGSIAFVQQNNTLPQTPQTSVAATYTAAQTAGDLNVVVIGWSNVAATISSVADSAGNTYTLAAGPTVQSPNGTQSIYFAKGIRSAAANGNTVTVTFSSATGYPDLRIAEYSGIDPVNAVDVVAAGQGSSTSSSSGAVTTNNANDLLVAGNLVQTTTTGAGTNFTQRVITSPDGDILEDQIVAATGSYTATAPVSPAGQWIMQMVAFRAAGSAPPPPISVTVSPTTANVATGSTQPFTATLQNDTLQQGVTWFLSGAGCSGSACGTLTNVTTTSVTYNGPTSAPSPATVTLAATSVADNTKSALATITVLAGSLSVTVSPRRVGTTLAVPQQFTATVLNDPLKGGVTWSVDGIPGGNTTVGVVSSGGLFSAGTQVGQHTVTATSVSNTLVSATATIAVTDLAGVFTAHNDTARTGQNLKEYALTPTTVSPSTFGLLFSCPVDGYAYAEPLYVANLSISGTTRNVLVIATEHDSVYLFDADSASCTQLWHATFLKSGVTTMPWQDTAFNGNQTVNDLIPEIGITSTPVIDPTTNTVYVEAKTKETVGTGCSASSPCYVHRLHALDLLTGNEKFGGPVAISATNFVPLHQHQRPALLLGNGTVYVAFGSHGDNLPYEGWLFGFNAATLTQTFAFATTSTNGKNAGAIWQGGGGPSIDASGNVYLETANGVFDGTTNYSDSVLKFSPSGTVLDYFTPSDQTTLAANDIDLGSASMVVLPDSVGSAAHPHLAVATGKPGMLYLLDQTNLGKFHSGGDQNLQDVAIVFNTTNFDGGLFGQMAYWNGSIFAAEVSDSLRQFTISNGALSISSISNSSNIYPLRGLSPSVSANGAVGGIVWALDLTGWQTDSPAILYAYDATNLATVFYTSPSSGTGAAGASVKFTTPRVANGKVYIGGEASFSVFGLLP